MHIDHEICFQVGLASFLSNKLYFYEDIPYALVPHFIALRFLTFSGNRHPSWIAGLHENSKQEVKEIVRYFMARPPFSKFPIRLLYLPISAAMNRFYKKQVDMFRNRNSNLNLEFEPRAIDIGSVFKSKIQAGLAFASQWKVFFNSEEEMRMLYHQFHSSRDGGGSLQERFWKPVPLAEKRSDSASVEQGCFR
jgi:hypothetical protein